MTKETKPRGWANLQQQLKEVREESFKQGFWKGQQDLINRIDKHFSNNVNYKLNKKEWEEIKEAKE